MTAPTVVGLDLSLTCSGLAGNAGGGWTAVLKPPTKLRGPERLNYLHQTLFDRYLTPAPDLVAVEGPSYGSQAGQSGHHERAGLWWLVVHGLWKRAVPYVVVSPKTRAKYATGNGNASKADVMREVARRFPWFVGGEDEADSLVLAAIVAEHLGVPMAVMPQAHRTALAAITWPDLPVLEAAA